MVFAAPSPHERTVNCVFGGSRTFAEDRMQSTVNDATYRVALARLGVPQWKLAAQLGVSPSTLSAFRRGHRTPPPDFIRRLEGALELQEGELTAHADNVEASRNAKGSAA